MADKDPRTDQEVSPHPQLVAVRGAVQSHCQVSRTEAARIANHLSHAECEQILDAGDDAKAVKHVAEGGWAAAEEKKAAAAKAKEKKAAAAKGGKPSDK